MPKPKKPKIAKIPKGEFSEKYNKLSRLKKVWVQRKMRKGFWEIDASLKKAEAEAMAFNEKLSGILLSLKGYQKTEVGVFEEKQTRYKLSKERKKLVKLLKEFQKSVEPWFKYFLPVSGMERSSSNPFEWQVHGLWAKADNIRSYLRNASTNLELIENDLRKRRR